MRKTFRALGVFMFVSMCVAPATTVRAANEVLSGNVKEADGVSGQNTNAGAGIKTGHLQNGAVTSAKIRDGSVTGADLASGAVTSAKIKDGNVLAADLANHSVTAPKVGFYSRVVIVDVNGGGDSVSPVAAMASIAGATSANPYLVKIMPGVYDVGQQPLQMQPFVDIEGSGEGATVIKGAVPSSAGGLVRGASDAQIRFLTIEDTTTDGFTAAFYAPPGTTPSLLHVTASTLGGSGQWYQAGVVCDAGSAPSLTHVRATASGGAENAGVYSISALPALTDVEATGADGSDFNVGVYLYQGVGAVLRGVRATASGGGGLAANAGIDLIDSSPVISDSTALASGHPYANIGIRNQGSGQPELTNVSARASGGTAIGMQNLDLNAGDPPGGYVVKADRCTFEGSTASVSSDQEYAFRIGASKLVGGTATAGGGTLRCVASYDENYNPLPSNCEGCLQASGTFHATGGPYNDIQACVDTLIGMAATKCCSGALNPAGGFQFGTNPYVCQGFCN